MGAFSTAIKAASTWAKGSSLPPGVGEAVGRQLDSIEPYVGTLEDAHGNAIDEDGGYNDEFWSDVARDATAGVVAAELLLPLAPIAAELLPMIAFSVPGLVPVLGVIALGIGVYNLAPVISAALNYGDSALIKVKNVRRRRCNAFIIDNLVSVL